MAAPTVQSLSYHSPTLEQVKVYIIYNTRFYDLFQVDFPLIDNNQIKGCKTRNCNASYRALRG